MDKQIQLLKIGDKQVYFDFPTNDHALFLSLGSCLAEIQAFEFSVASFLTSLARNSNQTTLDFDDLMNKHAAQTLGALIRAFRMHLKSSSVADLLEKVLERRNYIIHKILRTYGWPMMSDKEYLKAIQEIQDVRKLMREADLEVAKHLNDEKLLELIVVQTNPDTGQPEVIVGNVDQGKLGL